jgi:hypothetical protein
MSAGNFLSSRTNIDQVDLGNAAIDGLAQAALVDVDIAGEWFFDGAGNFHYHDGASRSIFLVGVTTITDVANGVLTLG